MTLTKQVMLSCSILFFAITVFLFSTLIYTASEGGQKEIRTASQESILLLQEILGYVLQSKGGEKKLPAVTEALLETGLYRHITIIDHDGNILLSKYSSPQISMIPEWFVNSLRQSPHQKSSLLPQHNKLMLQGYSIDVIAHPAFAYRYLWYLFIACLTSLLIAYVLCLLLLKTLLRKLLRPLHTIYEQIDSVGTQQFKTIDDSTSTIEIKKIIKSINGLSKKITQIMDAEVLLGAYFRKQVFIDPVTNCWNELGFSEEADKMIDQLRDDDDVFLILCPLKKEHLPSEKEIKNLSHLVTKFFHDTSYPSVLGTLGNTHLAILVQESNIDFLTKELLKTIHTLFPSSLSVFQWDKGHIDYFISHSLLLERQKKESHSTITHFDKKPTKEDQEHIEEVLNIIKKGKIHLDYQDIRSEQGTVAYELFCRTEIDGTPLPPLELIDIARKNKKIFELEYQIIEHGIEKIQSSLSNHITARRPFHINLSRDILEEEKNQEKIIDLLKRTKNHSQHIVFDLSENTIIHRKQETLRFIKKIHDKNLKNSIGLDRTILSPDFFSILYEFPLSHVKISGRMIQETSQKGAENLLLALLKMTQTLGIRIISDKIDTEEKWMAVKACGIEYFQGKIISDMRRL